MCVGFIAFHFIHYSFDLLIWWMKINFDCVIKIFLVENLSFDVFKRTDESLIASHKLKLEHIRKWHLKFTSWAKKASRRKSFLFCAVSIWKKCKRKKSCRKFQNEELQVLFELPPMRSFFAWITSRLCP